MISSSAIRNDPDKEKRNKLAPKKASLLTSSAFKSIQELKQCALPMKMKKGKISVEIFGIS